MEVEFEDFEAYERFLSRLRLEGAVGYMRELVDDGKLKTFEDVQKKVREDYERAAAQLSLHMKESLKWAGWETGLFEKWPYEKEAEATKNDSKAEVGFSEDERKLLEVAAKAEGQTVREFLHEAAMSWLASSIRELGTDLEQNAHMLSGVKEKPETSPNK